METESPWLVCTGTGQVCQDQIKFPITNEICHICLDKGIQEAQVITKKKIPWPTKPSEDSEVTGETKSAGKTFWHLLTSSGHFVKCSFYMNSSLSLPRLSAAPCHITPGASISV